MFEYALFIFSQLLLIYIYIFFQYFKGRKAFDNSSSIIEIFRFVAFNVIIWVSNNSHSSYHLYAKHEYHMWKTEVLPVNFVVSSLDNSKWNE